MKQISIDALNMHLFEAIEMLKNSEDTKADNCEKINVETAKAIADLGKVVIEGYKVKAQVMGIIKNGGNPQTVSQMAIAGGIIESKELPPHESTKI